MTRVRRAATPALAVLLAMLTWPVPTLHGRADLDGSWQLALHMAMHDGVDWGGDLQFTWGPLGFLGQPRWAYLGTTVAAFVFVLLGRALLCGTVLVAVRRRFGLPAGVVAAFAVGFLVRVELPEVLGTLVAVWCLLALGRPPERPLPRFAVEAAAACASVLLLVKFNAGLLAVGCVTVTAFAMVPRLLTLARLAGAGLVTFLICWLATGNAVGDVTTYLRGSVEVARGYSTAMGIEAAPRSGYAVAAAVAAVVLLLALLATRRAPWLRRAATWLVVGAVLFVKFKHAYVRHDSVHSHELLTVAVLLPAGLLRGGRTDRAVAALGGMLLVALGVFASRFYAPSDLGAAGRFATQVSELAVPGKRAALAERVRDDYRTFRPVDPALVGAAGDRGVHADPWDVSVVWANGLRWHPVPIFQSYSAYTPYLDERNAAAIADPRGPAVVLRRLPLPAIDSRVPTFESPAYQLAVLCHFRPAAEQGGWQLLERSPNRCGPARELGVVDAAAGRPVTVPAPRDPASLVVARFELTPPPGTRLRDLALKAPPVRVLVNGALRRLVIANAGQPHLLRASPTDPRLPSRGREVHTLELATQDTRWRVRFYEVPFSTR